jgi:hypothetical protein
MVPAVETEALPRLRIVIAKYELHLGKFIARNSPMRIIPKTLICFKTLVQQEQLTIRKFQQQQCV